MAGVYLSHEFGSDEIESAKTVAYIARALVLGETDTRKKLLANLAENVSWLAWRENPWRRDIAWRLLAALLRPDDEQQSSPPHEIGKCDQQEEDRGSVEGGDLKDGSRQWSSEAAKSAQVDA
jgi:hypothetical protein